jgi:hypothetical protein
MAEPSWQALAEEAEAALRRARTLAMEGPARPADREALRSMLTRLPEFIRDLSIARRRGRQEIALYRAVFEQLVTPLRSIA